MKSKKYRLWTIALVKQTLSVESALHSRSKLLLSHLIV